MLRSLLAIIVAAACLTPTLLAQTRPMAKPEDLGLRLPTGKTAFEVLDRSVLLPPEEDSAKEPVVAKVYLEVGSHYVVILPDGSLRSIAKRLTTETDRPFEALSKDDLAESLKKQFRGFKTRETRHYIFVYNASDDFCERKSKILESMYPMLRSYFRRQKLKPTEPMTPLVVVMFRTKKQFQAYRQTPDEMLAYYNTVSNRVFMYEKSDLNRDAPMIASKQSTSTIAHEGVHQILHNIGIQKRLSAWPLWVSEGLAEYFAPTTAKLRSKWSGVGRPNDLRMRELFIHLRTRPNLGDGSLIEDLVTTRQMSSIDYAVAWSLVHYLLTKHKDEFFEYLRDVSGGLPLEQHEQELQRFEEYFGLNLRKLEREMLTHVRSLPYADPIANQTYYLYTAVVGKKKYATVTSSRDELKVIMEMKSKMPVAHRAKAVFKKKTYPNQRKAALVMHYYLKN